MCRGCPQCTDDSKVKCNSSVRDEQQEAMENQWWLYRMQLYKPDPLGPLGFNSPNIRSFRFLLSPTYPNDTPFRRKDCRESIHAFGSC